MQVQAVITGARHLVYQFFKMTQSPAVMYEAAMRRQRVELAEKQGKLPPKSAFLVRIAGQIQTLDWAIQRVHGRGWQCDEHMPERVLSEGRALLEELERGG